MNLCAASNCRLFLPFGLLALLLLSVDICPTYGQQQQPNSITPSASSGSTSLSLSPNNVTPRVTLHVAVSDSNSRYVSGIDREAFTVSEDDFTHNIVSFSDSEMPASIGILFDNSGSADKKTLDAALRAADRLKKSGSPESQYFVAAFATRAAIASEWTSDDNVLSDGLSKLATLEPKGVTALYDAVYLSLKKVQTGVHRKQVLLLFTDGEDNMSQIRFSELRQALKESNVLVYSVTRTSRDVAGAGGQAILEELTKVTGGKAYFVINDTELFEVFERIALELKHQYVLEVAPPQGMFDGKWHRLKVRVAPVRTPDGKTLKLSARSREGYFARKVNATPTTSR